VALTAYQQQVQRLLHDPNATYYSLTDVTSYINTARNQIGLESQSIRVLVCGAISSVTVSAGGTLYAAADTIAVSGVGIGAVLTPNLSGGGAVTSVSVVSGGTSYDNTTTAAMVTKTGSGATLVPVVTGQNLTVAGQESYTFASRNAAAKQLNSGVNAILGLHSLAITWGSAKPMLDRFDWMTFQARFRSWTVGFQGQPAVWAMYGQGAGGSVFLCPIPSQVLNMDWDVFCEPIALVDDTTVEAIPYPWTDAVPYYAAYLAFTNAQRAEDAGNMFAQYEQFMRRGRAMSESTFIPSGYRYG
jgi:hypothetical protein